MTEQRRAKELELQILMEKRNIREMLGEENDIDVSKRRRASPSLERRNRIEEVRSIQREDPINPVSNDLLYPDHLSPSNPETETDAPINPEPQEQNQSDFDTYPSPVPSVSPMMENDSDPTPQTNQLPHHLLTNPNPGITYRNYDLEESDDEDPDQGFGLWPADRYVNGYTGYGSQRVPKKPVDLASLRENNRPLQSPGPNRSPNPSAPISPSPNRETRTPRGSIAPNAAMLTTPICILPQEVLSIAMSFLGITSVLRCMQTCRFWYEAAMGSAAWKKFELKFPANPVHLSRFHRVICDKAHLLPVLDTCCNLTAVTLSFSSHPLKYTQHVTQKWPNLVHLKLHHSLWTNEILKFLPENLETLELLPTSAVIRDTDPSVLKTKADLELLNSKMRNLKSLKLHIVLDVESIPIFSQYQNSQLERLRLVIPTVDYESLTILYQFPKLIDLELVYPNFSCSDLDDWSHIGDNLQRLSITAHNGVFNSKHLSKISHLVQLRDLEISTSKTIKYTETGLTSLAKTSMYLTTIILNRCGANVGSDLLSKLILLLASHPIKRFEIWWNTKNRFISSEHFKCFEGYNNLEVLGMHGCRNWVTNPNLLTDDDISNLTKSTPNLLSLSLFGCKELTKKSLQHLMQNCIKLQKADLEGCITDLVFTKFLKYNAQQALI
eukprot:TRINITY_DN7306_c0_g1_i2.p1 TRINITY_DN7306_c0_g1~~TRINITY_DN7306_c0_g1_i2.p1  ORF type:complete len:705 (+),score=174.67 TRINITY_DN7306_c0_g1_i2:115-2115(+)